LRHYAIVIFTVLCITCRLLHFLDQPRFVRGVLEFWTCALTPSRVDRRNAGRRSLTGQIIVLVHQQPPGAAEPRPAPSSDVTNPFIIINPSSGIIERQTEAKAARRTERSHGKTVPTPHLISQRDDSCRSGAKDGDDGRARLNGGRTTSATRKPLCKIVINHTFNYIFGQVVHTHVLLSPISLIWYRSRRGDALRLGR